MEKLNKVYAIAGQSFQQIGGECPKGFIEMQLERPDAEYVAKEDGTWIKTTTIVDNETVDPILLALAEAVASQEERLAKIEGGKTV